MVLSGSVSAAGFCVGRVLIRSYMFLGSSDVWVHSCWWVFVIGSFAVVSLLCSYSILYIVLMSKHFLQVLWHVKFYSLCIWLLVLNHDGFISYSCNHENDSWALAQWLWLYFVFSSKLVSARWTFKLQQRLLRRRHPLSCSRTPQQAEAGMWGGWGTKGASSQLAQLAWESPSLLHPINSHILCKVSEVAI